MWWLAAAWAQEAPDPDGVEPEVDPADVEEITVTGTRTAHALGDDPVATEVITRDEIERSGASSAADLLERVAGVAISHGALGAGLSLEGLDPDHTLILVDGQRVVGRKDGTFDLARLSPERIERIEIVKGPGSTLYGSDALGGVVNIVTRRPDGTSGTVDLRGGGFGTVDGSAFVEASRGPLGSATTVGVHQQDAYDIDPRTAATDGPSLDGIDATQELVLDATDDWELTGSLSYGTRGTAAVEEQRATAARFDRNNRTEEALASLVSRYVASEDAKLTVRTFVSAFRDQFFYDQLASNREDLYEDTRQTLADLDAQYDRVLGAHVLTVGFEGQQEWIVSPRLADGTAARSRVAALAQDELKLARGKVSLLPGARVDVDSQYGVAPTPRVAAAVFAGDDVVFRASYGLGFRAPDFKELYLHFENVAAGYVVDGNPDLRPERSLGGTLGVEVDLDRAHLAIQGFRNDVRDLVDFASADEGFSATQHFEYRNVARAWTMGADASASVTPIEPLTLRAGAQALATRDLALDRPLEGRAPFSGTFGAVVEVPRTGVELAVNGVWTTAPIRFLPPCAGDRSEGSVLLDARAGWTIAPGLELYAGGENLADVGDARCDQQKPLWGYLGLKAALGGR